MAGTKGKQKSARDMILSLGVIVLAAGVIWIFIPHDDGEPDLKRVDYRVELLTAQRAASYPVAAPQGLSQDWKATSVRFRGDDSDAWHLGFRAPDGEYVAVEQSTKKPSTFIADASQGARATERTDEIGGRTWTRYTGGRYDALVLQGGDGMKGATTVVAGTGSFEQLTKMAAALELA
ncbi:DUF4245 domain-containing protein [Streptomyces sp. NBC_00334]|uniref:DUF4245 domain-containing protein n=1 Tax=Streptomyces sp. NBC_00334 TaxID=2975713 RepID=UPI002E2AED7B|nr:DUF4245 domain-containing protein [Streptomyces sp. NBC_00334]